MLVSAAKNALKPVNIVQLQRLQNKLFCKFSKERKEYGTRIKFIRSLDIRGQYDFRLLPRHVFVPCRFEGR